MYNNGDLFTATQEFYNKVPYAKRSDFARSLANKTVDIKDGVQYIYVTGYIFKATGYMQGHIIAPYNNNTKKLLEEKTSAYKRVDGSRRSPVLWAETIRFPGGGSSGYSGLSERSKSDVNDKILGNASEGGISRDNESLRKIAGGAGENLENKRYAIDDSYLSAGERGDMKNAQRMVDEAAI